MSNRLSPYIYHTVKLYVIISLYMTFYSHLQAYKQCTKADYTTKTISKLACHYRYLNGYLTAYLTVRRVSETVSGPRLGSNPRM